MLTLEQATNNVIFTKGLFAFPLETFQFNWDILHRIFVSTMNKYERFCPRLLTIQTGGGNPIVMPENCIYPRAIGFGNRYMIAPQSVTVDPQSWTYDRQTRRLSVFTHTGSSAPFKVQYLAKYDLLPTKSNIPDYEVFEDEEDVDIKLDLVPDYSTLVITKGTKSLQVTERCRDYLKLSGTLGEGYLDLTSLQLHIHQDDVQAGHIKISYSGKYQGYDDIIDDNDFFETWYAANILSSMGNIKAVVKMDALPNDINADNLLSQGTELMREVTDWQKEKQYWFRGYLGARI